MNGPLKMYLTKPIVRHDLPVELPNCMYKIKNIHSVRNGTVITDADHVARVKENLDTFDQNHQALPDMTALVIRQEHILNQLADLKKQMLTLKDTLRDNAVQTASTSSTFQMKYIKVEEISEVVVNVSPLHPPYYLKVLQQLWSGTLQLNIKSHLHSTVADVPENVHALIEELENFKPKLNQQVVINVRLIWKNVGSQTELIVSKVPIIGEVNILRYLARATSTLNYETTTNPLELDTVLDTCYFLIRARTKTERIGLLQSLNKKLGKSQWFCGRSETSIADIAVYSALKQIPANEINVHMTKWLQKCETSLC